MRILHIVHQYMPDHVGGVELYTHGLSRGTYQQGHAVAVFTRQDRAGSGWTVQNVEGVQIYAAWAGELSPTQRYLAGFHNPTLVAAFRAAVDDFQPDLIHIEHLMGLPTALLDVVNEHNLPYIVTLWDYWWICANA